MEACKTYVRYSHIPSLIDVGQIEQQGMDPNAGKHGGRRTFNSNCKVKQNEEKTTESGNADTCKIY